MVTLIATLLLSPNGVRAAEYASTYSVESLVDAADDVATGRVLSMEASGLASGLIETEVRLVLDDAHGGTARRTVSFWLPGGQVGETVLTVPGTPRVAVDDRLMVFLNDGKPVGLAQGVWTSAHGGFTAASSAQNEALRIDESAVMGDVGKVDDCLDAHQQAAQDEGWSVRARLDQGNRAGTRRGVAVSLLEGLEYRLTVCGDGQTEAAWAQVLSPTEELLGEVAVDPRGSTVTLRPGQTGLYYVVVGADDLEAGAWRTRFGVAVAFR